MFIQMYDGIKLKRVTRNVGFSGYSQGKVYRFIQGEDGKYRAEGESLAFPLRSLAPAVDWEEVKEPVSAPPTPSGLFVVVSQDAGQKYGVFADEAKAITYITERQHYEVFRFHDNGETERMSLQLDGTKLYLATEWEVEQNRGGN